MDFIEYGQQFKENRNRNEQFPDESKEWIVEKSLSSKTTNDHTRNIMIFINGYLTCDGIIKMEDGIDDVFDFFDYWFIRKCLFSSVSAMKAVAANLKKFYQCMGELGHVDKDAYKRFWQEYKFYDDDFIALFETMKMMKVSFSAYE